MPTQIDKEEITKLNRAQPEEKHTFQIIFNRILTLVIIVVLSLLSYFLFIIISTSGQVFINPEDDSCSDWFCNVRNGFTQLPSIFGGEARLKGQSSGRTNILLLGVDATGVSGLSDTIMLASIFHKEKKIITVNIPRDTLAEYKGTRFKINEIYGTAESNKAGSGPSELSTFLSRELAIDIPYWALTNFDGLEKAVDLIGGVDINVKNTFTDCEFPNKTFGYLPCQTFYEGSQSMSGAKALIYARSRHGDNNEGTDFARSFRQSVVVQAILEKIKSQNIFQGLTKFNEIFSLLGKNIRTNMTLAEIKAVSNFGRGIDIETNFQRVNWSVGNGFLCDTNDPNYGYYIYYCADQGYEGQTGLNFNGQVMGTRPLIPTKAKSKAQQNIQNLAIEAQADTLKDLEIVILGNGAKSAQTIYNALTDQAYSPVLENITINNYYTKIPVTASPEKTTIYILDPAYNNLIKERLIDFSNFMNPIQFTIKNTLDENVKIPAKNQNARIIVYIE